MVSASERVVRALLMIWALACQPALAETATVAVATNFAGATGLLVADFEASQAHRLVIVTGSSGKLYAQVIHGAPFHALLSADQERPQRLIDDGRAQANSRFTYALGTLVLWSADATLLAQGGRDVLSAGRSRRLAIANPDLAPYGRAALQALRALGSYETWKGKLVIAENVGQAHAMVATGNAELGFVALSSLVAPNSRFKGSRWVVPEHCYDPVRQDAVLLDEENLAARAFLRYLRGPRAREIIARYGYSLPPGDPVITRGAPGKR